jgi:hypothetical protein
MIDDVDARLTTWISGVLPNVAVLLDMPTKPPDSDSVSVHLLELEDAPPARGIERSPLQVGLRYLVTAWSDDPSVAHRLLGQLLFAAMDAPDVEVQVAAVGAEAWAALGVAPRPSFFLRVPLRQPRPQPVVKPVLKPLVVQGTGMGQLIGVVLGPGDMPIADAFLELISEQQFTRTDSKGWFSFPAVPIEPQHKELRIKAKGREFPVTAEGPTPDAQPLVIRLDLLEG